jgi:replicative DNA helicase
MIDGVNLEAEKDLLSIFLNTPEMVIEHADKVRPDLFHDPFHKKLVATIRVNILDNKPIEVSALSNNKKEQRVIADLKLRDKSYEFFDSFYKILEEGLIARSLAKAVIGLKQRLSGDPDTIVPSDVLHKLRVDLESMEQLRSTSIFSISEIVDKVVDRHLDIYQHVQDGVEYTKDNIIETPFPTLNSLLKRGGLSGGELIVVAAPTSTGKTEISLNLCSYAAIENKKKIFIYSLEMIKESLVERILLERSKVDSFKLERGIINEVDIKRLQASATTIKNSTMFFEDNQSADIFDIITSIRKAHYKHGLDLVMIDYLQLARNPASTGNRNDEVASISRLLKQEATKLQIPIILISQLSRRHLMEGREPALHDLRDSGEIEQNADTVLLLYATNQERKNKVQSKTKGLLAKQREGAIGDYFMLNHKTIQTFAEISELEFKKGQKKIVADDEDEDTSMPF